MTSQIDHNQGMSQFNQLPSITVRRAVIVTGPSGAGKSQVINSLSGVSLSASAHSIKHVTQDAMQQIPGMVFRGVGDATFSLDFYDTRGFMDSKLPFSALLPGWNKLVKEVLTDVHYVVFVLPMDRYSSSLFQELQNMVEHLVKWGMKPEHVIVLLNKTDLYSDELVDSYLTSFRATDTIPEMLRGETTCLMPTCFLNVDEVQQNVRSIISEKVNSSRATLLSKLLQPEKVVPFNPRAHLVEEEEKAWKAQVADLAAKVEKMQQTVATAAPAAAAASATVPAAPSAARRTVPAVAPAPTVTTVAVATPWWVFW
jgi:GTPase SAR1 family protein